MPEGIPTIQAIEDGVQLTLSPGPEPLTWRVPIQGAIAFWHDWWQALGSHYPKEPQYPGMSNPMMFSTGDFSCNTNITSNGLVGLWLRPTDCAGIQFEFSPDQARQWAHRLIEAAEQAEHLVLPN